MSVEDYKKEITEEGKHLLDSHVSSPLVKGSEVHETGERHKPHSKKVESEHESQEGKMPSKFDQMAMTPGIDTQHKTEAEIEEELNKAALIETSRVKTNELVEDLEKTKTAREKEPESEKELAKRQKEQEEVALKQTKKHEEKKAEKETEKDHAVMDGSATRNSMIEEEKLMSLKADSTPEADKGASKEREI